MRRYLSLIVVAVVLAGCTEQTTVKREDEVRGNGAQVMPFDLDLTKHSFVISPDGGVQTVVVLDPADDTQIKLIRDHLEVLQEQFTAGNFSDPASIHGESMPGLAQLEAGSDQLTVSFTPIAGGGQLIYRSDNVEIVNAVHVWFAAQLDDHGTDATATPLGSHNMSEELMRQHHPELYATSTP